MVRTKSGVVLERILDATSATVLDRGYRGTRMADVAGRAGVSAGTLYLYAETKEALFELTLRRAFGDPMPKPTELPFSGSAGEELVEFVWQRLRAASPFPLLKEAAAREAPAGDGVQELDSILREVWEWQSRHWEAIELIERCARDWPELHALFYADFRQGLLVLGTQLLERRMRDGHLRRLPDPGVALRVIVENIAFFAMHRHIRPYTDGLEEDVCRETVIAILTAGFAPEAAG